MEKPNYPDYPANNLQSGSIYPNVNQPPPYQQPTAVYQPQQYPPQQYPPQQATTNIIIATQPGSVGKREWSHGLCGCFDDCGEFMFAYCCTPCYEVRLFSMANEGFCSCLFGGLVPLRTKIRTERRIDGSICEDFWAVICCPLCAMIQMSNEIKDTTAAI